MCIHIKLCFLLHIFKPISDRDQMVVVTASDAKYYPSLRVALASIKRRFGVGHPVIVYDLGGLSTDPEMVRVIKSVG